MALREQVAKDGVLSVDGVCGPVGFAPPQSVDEREGVFAFVEVFAEPLLLGVLTAIR